jgi:hypothetical protein
MRMFEWRKIIFLKLNLAILECALNLSFMRDLKIFLFGQTNVATTLNRTDGTAPNGTQSDSTQPDGTQPNNAQPDGTWPRNTQPADSAQ